MTFTCIYCGKIFTSANKKSKLCSVKCRNNNCRWEPNNKTEFIDFYINNSCNETAVKYGVERHTISKYAIEKCKLPFKSFLRKNIDCKITFTERQLDILNGSILGDGCFTKLRTSNSNSNFHVTHSIKQEGWLKWKHQNLIPFVNEIKYGESYGRKRSDQNGKIVNDFNKKYYNCSFYTFKHPVFKEMEKQWYKRDSSGNYVYKMVGNRKTRIKVLPDNFSLSPLSLSILFIDDGSNNCPKKHHNISTLCFEEKEVQRILEEIKKNGIKHCDIYKYKNVGFYICINSTSYLDFIDLVNQQIPDLPVDVKYKVDISKFKNKTRYDRNTVGIPRFIMRRNKYCGNISINKKNIHLGTYHNYFDALFVSKEIQKLVKDNCKDVEKYKAIVNVYKKPKINIQAKNNTSIRNCSYSKNNLFELKMQINKKFIYLGEYKDKEIAKKVSDEANGLRENGCFDILEYYKIKNKYKKMENINDICQ